MEFASRAKCINHFQDQYPNLPRYMIEMALEYDLQNGGANNEKPLTSAQKRKQKRNAKSRVKRDTSMQDQIQEALQNGKPLEIDCAKVIPHELYEPAPPIPGAISVDGAAMSPSLEPELEAAEKLEEINLSID